MARGAFPDDHELALGMPGMHGNYTAITALQKADLLIALGSRFDDRVTGKVTAFAPDAKVIHVDIDPAELGKVRRPDVPIVGDCKGVIETMVSLIVADWRVRVAAGQVDVAADDSRVGRSVFR
jgi:acetolactate synthase-1/2/3 large subunit